MNPNLTANLRADRELKAEIEQQQLAAIQEKLATAQPLLTQAHEQMVSNGLDKRHGELFQQVTDALYYCGEALYHIAHHPQPDQ